MRKIIFCLLFLTMTIAAGAEETAYFVYDDKNKRDPMWPLVSTSGGVVNYETDLVLNDLNLEGILRDKQGQGVVIINGRVMKSNDVIGQFVVAEIHQNYVVMTNGAQRFELRLKKKED